MTTFYTELHLVVFLHIIDYFKITDMFFFNETGLEVRKGIDYLWQKIPEQDHISKIVEEKIFSINADQSTYHTY